MFWILIPYQIYDLPMLSLIPVGLPFYSVDKIFSAINIFVLLFKILWLCGLFEIPYES